MNEATSHVYNNENKEFSTASISLDMPKNGDLTHIGKSIKSYLSNETESMNKYDEVLKKSPTVKIIRVGLTTTNDKISCEYVYFVDKNAAISQKPLLYKINGPRQQHFILADHTIEEITPIEYLFDLPKNQHGFRLFNLEFNASAPKSSVNNQDILKRIGDVITSNNLLDFYEMDQPVQYSLAVSLAQSATSNLKIPTFVNQNPIHVTPAMNKTPLRNLDISDEENINAKQMEEFNENRYVDANTGINTTRQILNQMRAELGLLDSRFKIGDEANTDLSINTNNYTREEIQQSERKMQQEKESKWNSQ
ncbi:hypothetical protein V6380_16195 [Acinetobacter variabilis]|uniref:hypothetical protein n=1 Tax=Acinetobacter variabilis TaxID=70346 RepID=UPI003B842273